MSDKTELRCHMNVDQQYQSNKTLTFVLYVMYIAAIFSAGILALIALIINYAKRSSVRGTIFETHFAWQIRTVWWYVLWNILACIPLFAYLATVDSFTYTDDMAIALASLGLTTWGAVVVVSFIWIIYRGIKGLIVLNENRAI